jgi:hypothetical protein
MIYIKGAIVATIALIASVATFMLALGLVHLDARYFLGQFPVISLPAMTAIFFVVLLWRVKRDRKRSQ